MARRPLPSLVLAFAAAAVLASTAWAAPSDPPAVKTTAQAAGHGPQAAPAPAKKIEPAPAADAHAAPAPKKAEAAVHVVDAAKKPDSSAPTGHGEVAGSTSAASHGTPAAPVKKNAKVDRKAIEAEVRQVVTHITAAMKEASEKPASKSLARAESGGHAEPGLREPAAPARSPRTAGKPRPKPLLVWDDTLKGGNVTLVWDAELARRPTPNGARLVWGEEKK